jgi:hypothetical protein
MSAHEEVVEAGFSEGALKQAKPRAYIQWKGTDVCMDFHCECGACCHFDGAFAYTVKCPHCETVWEMPTSIYPRKADVERDPYWYEHAQPLEPDEDWSPSS